MNKYLLKIFFVGLGIILLGLGSCKKRNLVVDQDALIPPTFAKFNVVPSSVYTTDSTATYYVKDDGKPFKLPVGITTVADKDRTVNFTYSSTSAVQGVQYTAPTSLTIPKGEALDSLTISGIFTGIAVGEVDTLKIQITGTDEVPMSPYKNHFEIYIRKSCPIVMTDFEGAFNNTYDNGTYGPYTTILTPGSIVMITPTKATFTIENIYDLGVPVITNIEADWTTDPDHPTVTIPDQVFFGPADYWIKGAGTSTFSACDQTITLRYTIYDGPSGTDLAPNQETIMTR